jgi:hypothetical protein
LAVANYHDTYGSFPPAYIADETGKPMHSWRVLLLPFLEQRELYEQYDFREPWDGPNNRKLLSKRPSLYAFHGTEREASTTTNYLAVVGRETVWPGDQSLSMAAIGDDPARTILVVENQGGSIPWTEPRDLEFASMNMDVGAAAARGISSRFSPPAVVTAAGYVHTLAPGLAPETLRALLTASGGEQIAVDENLQEVPDARNRPPIEP